MFFIKEFLSKFHLKWTSQDISSLIVLGPIISLMIKIVSDYENKSKNLTFNFASNQDSM